MLKGYMGKLLFVNLTTGEITEETPDESLYRDFIGGYGIGAKIIYERQKVGVDALGPDNMFGLITGPLTGTPANTGARYTVVCKSPLTGGWGDANSGGIFGPTLKFAGYDGVFFTGISDKPVYLFINNGKAELRDAASLWGKDVYETEDMLREELGKGTEVVCIGPSGEKLSLISCVITEKGAAAGRSGVGAVMGSKKLKAVAVKGDQKVPLADEERANTLRRDHVKALRTPRPNGGSFLESFHTYGTTGMTARSAHSGDTPVKNWGGVGIVDFPDVTGLGGDDAIANLDKRVACWHCPIGCQAGLKEGTGEYKYPAGTRRPEYETQGTFGTMCLNNNTESIAMANHICNAYGLDTISAGCVIAFAIECYENGLITKEDTDGIELTWGNHRAIIDMTWKMAKREGFGDILADGVMVAAEKIGKGAEQYAVHIGGQELGMHDPKLSMRPGATPAARYQMDATPGRHTAGFGPGSFRGHIVNATGVCSFGFFGAAGGTDYLHEFFNAVTGAEFSMQEILKAGERIANIRHVFNLREGINPLEIKVHPRITGNPPQKDGPLAGVTADINAQNYWNLGALDWDRVTTKPSKKKLLELGLDEIAEELWPPAPPPGPRP
ncbi:MAG: aldehyde ferredoxin oxidoreductase family protein [Dehalococcoidales bacterium]